ncbi:heme utilization protein [Pseudomonas sp. GB2N2]
MKPSMALKPLVFAIAALMAVAVQANGNDNDDHHNGHHHNGGNQTPPPKMIPISATANANDKQSSTGNRIYNQGTENSAEMSSSAAGASGNVGVNVAAGSGNQQDNAAAIANAASDNASIDNSFVFGTASATSKVTQVSNNNRVENYSTTNSAVMSGSGGGASGNMGINIAGGDLNQQKNTMAIANSSAPLGNASATASADQSGPGLTVVNGADRTYSLDTLSFTTTHTGSASFNKDSNLSVDKSKSSNWAASGSNSWDASGSKSSSASGSASTDSSASSSASINATLAASADAAVSFTRNNGNGDRTRSASGNASLNASLDASVNTSNQSSTDSSYEKAHASEFAKSFDSSYDKSGEKSSSSSKDVTKSFSESSSFDLSNTYSYQVLTPTGWANPVTNTATLSGSVNGGSGNLGVNVAAGVGNQQSNSLAISNQSF